MKLKRTVASTILLVMLIGAMSTVASAAEYSTDSEMSSTNQISHQQSIETEQGQNSEIKEGIYIIPILDLESTAPLPAVKSAFSKAFGSKGILNVDAEGNKSITVHSQNMIIEMSGSYYANIKTLSYYDKEGQKHEATVNSTRQSKYSTTFGDPSKTEEITVPDEMTFSLIEQEDQEKGAYKLNCTVDFMDNFLGGGDAYPTDITLKVDLDNLMQTEELEALIKATESYAAENYSAESWQNFQEALTAAKAALENAASQAELDNAKQGLEEAITALEPELEQGKYTVPLSLECTVSIPLAPVKEAFSSAFGDTGAINVDNDGSMELIVKNRQMIIDFFSMSTMYANLSDIYYYDETGVKQSVTVKNTIESEYSVGDSVEKIEIPEILSFPLVKQEDGTYRISAYVDYMNKTYDMIINLDFSDCVKLEKTQTLEKEIEEAEAIKAADYTKESYRNLQAAIKTAKSSLIWAQTQEEIELALKDLDTAVKALKRNNMTPETSVPKAPAGVKAASAAYNKVKISWSKVSGATGYEVLQYNNSTKKYGRAALVKGTAYIKSGLKTGTKYSFRIRAYKTTGGKTVYSPYSKTVSAKPVLAKVRNVKAKNKTKRSAAITWKRVAGANGYKVYRSTKKNGKFKAVKTIKKGKTVKFVNKKLKKGKRYYYKVRAYRTVGKKKVYSGYSSRESVKIRK